ncbi:MAG: hypothetical protein ACUVWP_03030 [bacterium]
MERSFYRYTSVFTITLLVLNIFLCEPVFSAAPGTGPMVGDEDTHISTFVWIAAGGFVAIALFQSIRDAYKKKKEKLGETKLEYILIPINTDEIKPTTTTDEENKDNTENTDESNNPSDN